MKFNEKLLSLRKENGYSQEVLADKLNVSRQTISKWESGLTTPELEKIILLSEIFNISVDELVGKENAAQIDENKEKNKLNLKKSKNKIIKKIIIIIITIFIILLGSLVLYRYLIVDSIYKRIFYYEPEKNEFCYTKRVVKYENNIPKKWILEETFVKDKVFKTEYYDTEISPTQSTTKPILRRIEYGDEEYYYNINSENKTYTKTSFEKHEFYANTNFSNLTFELEGVINGKFNLNKLQNRILMSLDFRKIIKIRQNYYELGIADIDNFFGLPQSVSVINDLKKPVINFNRTDVDKDNKSNFIMYSYEKDFKDIADEEIMLPDLSTYTLVDSM